MPPPAYGIEILHLFSPFTIYSAASAFLRGVLFAFGFSSTTATGTAATGFTTACFFKRFLIAILFLELPNEPLNRLPFFDFLSPFPMFPLKFGDAIIAKGWGFYKLGVYFRGFFDGISRHPLFTSVPCPSLKGVKEQ
jgi:hypothetical protein